jgi:hypothetical protein
MGYTYYAIDVLIPPSNTLTFEDIAIKIRDHLAGISDSPTVIIESDRMKVQRDEWELRIYWEDKPHVLEESREIAKRFAQGRADADVIASCKFRITTAADPDPDMTYFNDYVFVLEALESIKNIYIFDPYDGKFI